MFYRDFLAKHIRCSNAYNADTEAPNDDDAFISTIRNSEQLRFEKYIHDYKMVHGVITW